METGAKKPTPRASKNKKSKTRVLAEELYKQSCELSSRVLVRS